MADLRRATEDSVWDQCADLRGAGGPDYRPTGNTINSLRTRVVPEWFSFQAPGRRALPTIYYLRERAGRDGRMLAARIEPRNGPNVQEDGIIAGEPLTPGAPRQIPFALIRKSATSFWMKKSPIATLLFFRFV